MQFSAAMIAVSVKPCIDLVLTAYSSGRHCDLVTLTCFSCSGDFDINWIYPGLGVTLPFLEFLYSNK